MKKFLISYTNGHSETIEASRVDYEGEWVVFRTYPPQGGPAIECFRSNVPNVMSIATYKPK